MKKYVVLPITTISGWSASFVVTRLSYVAWLPAPSPRYSVLAVFTASIVGFNSKETSPLNVNIPVLLLYVTLLTVYVTPDAFVIFARILSDNLNTLYKSGFVVSVISNLLPPSPAMRLIELIINLPPPETFEANILSVSPEPVKATSSASLIELVNVRFPTVLVSIEPFTVFNREFPGVPVSPSRFNSPFSSRFIVPPPIVIELSEISPSKFNTALGAIEIVPSVPEIPPVIFVIESEVRLIVPVL